MHNKLQFLSKNPYLSHLIFLLGFASFYTMHSVLKIFQPKQQIPKGLSIFLSKVVIGDLESVEKIIPQQHPSGVTS